MRENILKFVNIIQLKDFKHESLMVLNSDKQLTRPSFANSGSNKTEKTRSYDTAHFTSTGPSFIDSKLI